MGNCLKRGRNMEWDGEDWEPLTPKHRLFDNRIIDNGENYTGGGHVEKQRLLGENEDFSSSTVAAASTTTSSSGRDQVKLKITKRELEELVRRDMEGGLSLEEFLASLFNTSDDRCRMDHHRAWRPVLQSIPEVN